MALTADQIQAALVAFQRFGLGPKPDALVKVAKNAKAAIRTELRTPGIARIVGGGLPSYPTACKLAESGKADELRRKEMAARIDKHLSVKIGFVERLVLFWSNHFSMSIDKADAVRGTLGQLERDVIRRNVLGNFYEMLIGVIRHPAMVAYLDNDDSIGPTSKTGIDWGVGYNENLAREILELYTVGSGGGYTEADVTEFALALTGWSFVRGWEADGRYNEGHPGNRGRFIFRKSWHEPGTRRIMGASYRNTQAWQATAVLRDLVRNPKTGEHIAFKLVRHFITDEPTPEMVAPIAAAFNDTDGNLRAVAEALIDLPAAWSAPLTKIRQPYETQIAAFRALGTRYKDDESWAFSEVMRFLHQSPWQCPSPEGWADETRYWLAPDAMTIRLDSSRLVGQILGERVKRDPLAQARRVYGPALSEETRNTIAVQADRADGFTAFLMSPEFQRR